MKKKQFLFILILSLITSISIFYCFKRRMYIVIDVIAQKININNEYVLPRAKGYYCQNIFSKSCMDISENIKLDSNLDTKNIGKYQVTYTLNFKGKAVSKKVTIEVADIENPVIKLDNYDKLTLCPNYNLDKINDYNITDNYDINIENKLIKYIKNSKIYYSVTDDYGNTTTVNRDVELIDTKAPQITLNGSDNVYIYKGTEYKELGYSAYDECDGDITNKVKVEGNVDYQTIGDYTITYTAIDSSKNKYTKTRTIHVYDYSIGNSAYKNGKIVYLTFDDGPNSYTKNILNVLNKYNVKATFFITNQFYGYQSLIHDMYEYGHSVGIHTYSHQYRNIYSSEEAYFNDLNKMNEIIFKQTGSYSQLLRFPGGSSNTISSSNKGIMSKLSKLVTDEGYTYFDWNIDSGDTSTINAEVIANNVINGIKKYNTSIVLMHDTKYVNKEALEKILYYGLTNGYTFLPLTTDSPTMHHNINN